MPLLNREDFCSIGDIANHCDMEKLDIAILQAGEFDMENLFCGFWYDITDNWESNDPKWIVLINGGTYEGCNRVQSQKGIKEIFAYYAYARYVMLNPFNDTPNGMVAKTNQFSIPTPLKDLQSYSDKYRNMGKQLFDRTLGYLCKNRDFFTGFTSDECAPCGCNGSCGKKQSNTKGYGFSSSVITKKI